MWLLALNEMQRKEYEEEQRATREREQKQKLQLLQQQHSGKNLWSKAASNLFDRFYSSDTSASGVPQKNDLVLPHVPPVLWTWRLV